VYEEYIITAFAEIGLDREYVLVEILAPILKHYYDTDGTEDLRPNPKDHMLKIKHFFHEKTVNVYAVFDKMQAAAHKYA
jgi:hypothetical protein